MINILFIFDYYLIYSTLLQIQISMCAPENWAKENISELHFEANSPKDIDYYPRKNLIKLRFFFLASRFFNYFNVPLFYFLKLLFCSFRSEKRRKGRFFHFIKLLGTKFILKIVLQLQRKFTLHNFQYFYWDFCLL